MFTPDTLVGLIAPHLCMSCQSEGLLLCGDCLQSYYQSPAPRCTGCFVLQKDFSVCKKCKTWLPLQFVQFSGIYEGVNEQLVKAFKFEYKRAAVKPIAQILYLSTSGQQSAPDEMVLCPIPTAPSRVRVRGFDHTKLLAKQYSRLNGIEVKQCLSRTTNTRQVGSSRKQRIKHMQSEFKSTCDVRGKQVLLIDDVMTSGATLAAAATLLKKSGAKSVGALVFARQT